jgi:hypothetical protein
MIQSAQVLTVFLWAGADNLLQFNAGIGNNPNIRWGDEQQGAVRSRDLDQKDSSHFGEPKAASSAFAL